MDRLFAGNGVGPNSQRNVNNAGGLAESPMTVVGAIRRLPKYVGIGLIKGYRYTLSPFLGRQCRYLPTCSHYTEESIERFGLWAGAWIGISRVLRCGPFGASGFDPIPDELPPDAAWYLPWRYGIWSGDHIDPKTRLDLE